MARFWNSAAGGLAAILFALGFAGRATAQTAAPDPRDAQARAIAAQASRCGFTAIDMLPREEFEARVGGLFRQEGEKYWQMVRAKGPGNPEVRRHGEQLQRTLQPEFVRQYHAALAAGRPNEAHRLYQAVLLYPPFPISNVAVDTLCANRESRIAVFDDTLSRIQQFADRVARMRWQARGAEPGDPPVPLQLIYNGIADLDRHKAERQQWASELQQLRQADPARPPSMSWHHFPNMAAHWHILQKPKEISVHLGVSLVGVGSVFESLYYDIRMGDAGQMNYLAKLKVSLQPGWFWAIDEKYPRGLIYANTPRGVFALSYFVQPDSPDRVNMDDFRAVRLQMLDDLGRALVDVFQPKPPAESPATAARLILETPGETRLKTSPHAPSQCRLLATLIDGQGQRVAGARIAFRRPALGKLDRLEATTDANGEAAALYTAPTDADLKKAGLEKTDVHVEASAGAPWNASDAADLHVSGEKGQIEVLSLAYEVLPANPDCINTVELAFDLPGQTYETTYRAEFSVSSPDGALWSPLGDWIPRYETDVEEHGKVTLRYRWIGDASKLTAPVCESIVVTIPKLKLKTVIEFDVGLDLEIEKVERWAGGPVFYMVPEKLVVLVRDKFPHKVEPDLAKLCEDFKVQPGARVAQVHFQPVQVFDAEEVAANKDFVARLLGSLDATMAHGFGVASEVHSVPRGELRKTPRGWTLCRKTQYGDGTPMLDFPWASLQSRGDYVFTVALLGVERIDCRLDNEERTIELSTRDYSSPQMELMYTVGIPALKLAAALPAAFASEGVQFFAGHALASSDFVDAMGRLLTAGSAADREAAILDGVTSLIGFYQVNAKNLLRREKLRLQGLLDNKEISVQRFSEATMAIAKSLERIENKISPALDFVSLWKPLADAEIDFIAWWKKKPPQGETRVKSRDAADTPLASLRVGQAGLRGLGGHWAVVLERTGLTGHQVAVQGGAALQPAPSDPAQLSDPAQRVAEGQHVIIVLASAGERLSLRLSGSGGSGRLILVTPNTIRALAYPAQAWQATLIADSSPSVAREDGSPIDWQPDASVTPPPVPTHDRDDRGPTVATTVSDRAGQPLSGVRVLVRRQGQSLREALAITTDDQGRASLALPAPGDYDVLATKPGYQPSGLKLTVPAGAATQASLILEPAQR